MVAPSIFMYGNCNIEALWLAVDFSSLGHCELESYYVSSYKDYGLDEQSLNADALAGATCCWVQTGDDYGDQIIANAPPGCQIVRLPPLNFSSFWPFGISDPLNTPEPEYPFGRYPYGDEIIIDLTSDRRILPSDASSAYEERLLVLTDQIQDSLCKDRNRRLARDSQADVPLGAFSEWLSRRRQSHFSYNHPCADLLEYAFRSCCNATRFLEGSASEMIRKGMEFFACNEPFGGVAVPISPQVLSLLGASWQNDDGLFTYHGRRIALAEYLEEYLSYRRDRLGMT